MTVSVAICTYNGEQYILEQLKSIENQTLVPDEIVICDDCSTDKTLEIIKEWSEEVQICIRLIKNERNIGFFLNFQKAMSLCSCDLIFLSDQDDVWFSEKVKVFVDHFVRNPKIDVVFSNALLIRTEHRTQEKLWDIAGFTPRDISNFNSEKGILSQLLLKNNVATGATMALRKDFLKKKLPLFENNYFFHDYLLATLAAINNSLGLIENCYMYYRLHIAQNSGIKEELQTNQSVFNLLIKAFSKKYSSEITFIKFKVKFYEYLLQGFDDKITWNKTFLLKGLNHFKNRERIITHQFPFNVTLGFKELILGNYKFSTEMKKSQIKLVFKDILTRG